MRRHLGNSGFSPPFIVMSAGYFSFVIKLFWRQWNKTMFYTVGFSSIQQLLFTRSSFLSPRLHLSQSLSLCQHFSCSLTFSVSSASLSPSLSLSVSISAKSSTQLSVVCPEPIKQSSTKWQLIHSFGFWFLLQSTRTHWSSGYMVWIHCIQLQSGAKSSSILLKAAMKHLCVEWICSRLSVNTLLSTASSSLWAF